MKVNIIPEIDDLTKYDLEYKNEIFNYIINEVIRSFDTHNRREESPHLALFELGKILCGLAARRTCYFYNYCRNEDKLNEQ